MASAIAGAPGEMLTDLEVRWALAEAPVESGYRSGPRRRARVEEPADLRAALRGYLEAIGERETSSIVASAGVELAGTELRLSLATSVRKLTTASTFTFRGSALAPPRAGTPVASDARFTATRPPGPAGAGSTAPWRPAAGTHARTPPTSAA